MARPSDGLRGAVLLTYPCGALPWLRPATCCMTHVLYAIVFRLPHRRRHTSLADEHLPSEQAAGSNPAPRGNPGAPWRLLADVSFWVWAIGKPPALGAGLMQVQILPSRLAFLTRSVTRLLNSDCRFDSCPTLRGCDAHGGHFAAYSWEAS